MTNERTKGWATEVQNEKVARPTSQVGHFYSDVHAAGYIKPPLTAWNPVAAASSQAEDYTALCRFFHFWKAFG